MAERRGADVGELVRLTPEMMQALKHVMSRYRVEVGTPKIEPRYDVQVGAPQVPAQYDVTAGQPQIEGLDLASVYGGPR